MTKRELSERLLSYFPDLEKKDLDFLVDQFFELLAGALREGKTIELRGFGILKAIRTRSYMFNNPKNLQRYYLRSKVRAVFSMGKELKERLNSPLFASLDLGTQTFRMLFGKKVGEEVFFLASFRENVRLGEGLADQGVLSESAMERALVALRRFKDLMEEQKVSDYYAVGTAVFRKAGNAEEFISKVERELGIKIEVLSPEREAELTLEGIKYGLKKLQLSFNRALILDLGGGSTEFILLEGETPLWMKSLDLGVVLLRDTFRLRYPVTKKTLQSIRDYIRDQLSLLPDDNVDCLVITGGSASLLGRLDLRLQKYDPERLHGHRVTTERIEKLIQRISELTLPRIRAMRGMEEGREDIILPGLLVYAEILKKYRKEELLISEYGILEASLLYLLKRYN